MRQNAETVRAYRNRHMAYRAEHVWERLSDEAYLERIGAVKLSARDNTLHPTAAGLLMSGEEYKILYELAMSGRIAVSGKNKGRRYKRI